MSWERISDIDIDRMEIDGIKFILWQNICQQFNEIKRHDKPKEILKLIDNIELLLTRYKMHFKAEEALSS